MSVVDLLSFPLVVCTITEDGNGSITGPTRQHLRQDFKGKVCGVKLLDLGKTTHQPKVVWGPLDAVHAAIVVGIFMNLKLGHT